MRDLYEYDPVSRIDWMQSLIHVLRYDPSGVRGWHAREQRSYSFHEAVWHAVKLSPPKDWHLLVLEWPHISTGDPNRLAYTRDDRAGHDNKQTITTIGKYLHRHFPKLADHQIRDIAALHSASGCEIVRTTDEILDTLQRGPHSCMRWNDCHHEHHPYRVYAPALGWGMARRVVDGDVCGRALVYEDPYENYKCYVRSYKKGDGYSYADEMLEAWLKQQGYEHRTGWPEGARMAHLEPRYSRYAFLAPYIDGDIQNVDVVHRDGGLCLVIRDGGEYVCNNTDGTPENEGDDHEECHDCGDYQHPDDMYWVGSIEDCHVCSGCQNNYVTALTYQGREREIHENNVIYLDSTDMHYDVDYLDRNGVITLANGDYEHRDNAWRCEHDGEYYSYDEDSIEVTDARGNTLTIHPDHADEYNNDENEGE